MDGFLVISLHVAHVSTNFFLKCREQKNKYMLLGKQIWLIFSQET